MALIPLKCLFATTSQVFVPAGMGAAEILAVTLARAEVGEIASAGLAQAARVQAVEVAAPTAARGLTQAGLGQISRGATWTGGWRPSSSAKESTVSQARPLGSSKV